jgi:hypothetical protein
VNRKSRENDIYIKSREYDDPRIYSNEYHTGIRGRWRRFEDMEKERERELVLYMSGDISHRLRAPSATPIIQIGNNSQSKPKSRVLRVQGYSPDSLLLLSTRRKPQWRDWTISISLIDSGIAPTLGCFPLQTRAHRTAPISDQIALAGSFTKKFGTTVSSRCHPHDVFSSHGGTRINLALPARPLLAYDPNLPSALTSFFPCQHARVTKQIY